MFLHIRAIPHREAVDINLLDEPALHERVEAIINGCHRNVGHPFLCPHENLLSSGMIAFLEHDTIDVLALGSGAKATAGEPFPKLFCMDAILHRGTVAQEPPKSIVGIILNLNKPCKLFLCRNRPSPTREFTLAIRSLHARGYSDNPAFAFPGARTAATRAADEDVRAPKTQVSPFLTAKVVNASDDASRDFDVLKRVTFVGCAFGAVSCWKGLNCAI
jgi:hypothetical protein